MTREELIDEVRNLRSILNKRREDSVGEGTGYSFEEIRDLFERVPVGLYKSSPDGEILDVNSTLLRILGYPNKKTIRDMNTNELYRDPEDQKRWMKSVKENGTVQNFEVKIKRRDGGTIWVNDNARAIFDEEGKIRFYEGAIFDITKERELRDELMKSEARFKTLFENSLEGIVMTDPEGRILMFNRKFSEMFGYEPYDIEGDYIDNLVTGNKDIPEAWEITRKVADGEPVSLEARRYKKDGTPVQVSILAQPIMVGGKQKAVYSIYRDITERKEAVKALEDSEERFRDLVDKSRAAIFIDDKESNLVYFNDRFPELFGYSADEIRKKRFLELIHSEDRPRIERIHRDRYSGKGGESRYEFKGYRKDGSVISLQADVVEIIKNGKITGTRAYIWDVTEIKEAEEKVKGLNDLLKLMNKILRHDIGNNLTAAVTAIDWYRTSEDEKTLDIAEKSVMRSMETISEMSSLEDLLTKGSDLQSRSVGSIIRSTAEHFSVGIEIEGDCKAMVDEGFPTVIENLVGNAIEHGKSDKVRFEIEGSVKDCTIRVIDYGGGIPNEIKEKVFEEGYRHRHSRGSGLGLFIVNKTIQRYGGDIRIEDNDPRGAIFVIKLRRGD